MLLDEISPNLVVLDNAHNTYERVNSNLFPNLGDSSLINSVLNKMQSIIDMQYNDKKNLRVTKKAYCGSKVSVTFNFPGKLAEQNQYDTLKYIANSAELELIKEYIDQFQNLNFLTHTFFGI